MGTICISAMTGCRSSRLHSRARERFQAEGSHEEIRFALFVSLCEIEQLKRTRRSEQSRMAFLREPESKHEPLFRAPLVVVGLIVLLVVAHLVRVLSPAAF